MLACRALYKFATESWNVPFNKGICRSGALLDRKVRLGSSLSNVTKIVRPVVVKSLRSKLQNVQLSVF